jgi:hypothetical protein
LNIQREVTTLLNTSWKARYLDKEREKNNDEMIGRTLEECTTTTTGRIVWRSVTIKEVIPHT